MSIFLIRHASAGTRGELGMENDLERALDPAGIARAEALADELGDRGIEVIFTSSAVRCRETIGPLARALGLDVDEHRSLLEEQSGRAAADLIGQLARSNTTAALCSHGDIIPAAIQTLATEGLVISGLRGWAKGSVWEIETRGGDPVRAIYLGPF